MTENEISKIVLDCAIKIHKQLGPGLLENVYKECLAHELSQRGLSVRKEVPLPVYYEGVKLEVGYRLDILIENKVLIEIKSVEAIHDLHKAQVLTYLKLSDCKLGLLINFNVLFLMDGYQRLVRNL